MTQTSSHFPVAIVLTVTVTDVFQHDSKKQEEFTVVWGGSWTGYWALE